MVCLLCTIWKYYIRVLRIHDVILILIALLCVDASSGKVDR